MFVAKFFTQKVNKIRHINNDTTIKDFEVRTVRAMTNIFISTEILFLNRNIIIFNCQQNTKSV
jgi:hypothetical protein